MQTLYVEEATENLIAKGKPQTLKEANAMLATLTSKYVFHHRNQTLKLLRIIKAHLYYWKTSRTQLIQLLYKQQKPHFRFVH